ncbi:MAG TPA: hypothetical protein PKO39_08100, partial [Bacilli bacterium]|nr:hypothetical protein [Bacilli bacterium]
VTFNFVVLEGEKPDDSELPFLAASFLVIQTENVVDDLELPVTGRFDTTITWESSNEDIIASDGTVTRPAAATGNPVKVMLTATITYGDFSAVKTFIVNVLELEPQDNQEIANIAFNSLRLDYVLVTDNELVLPFEGAFDTVFTFETDNANVAVDENVLSVNRLSQDYYVKVKATTVIDEQSYDFYFGFVVKAAAKGSGTLEDPFVIETAEDLAKVGTGTDGWTLDAHYALFNDIDMSTICGEELGTFAGIGSASDPFTGTFNGNGYTVSNLYMNLPEQERVGLFNAAVKAEIKNFHLKDAVVIGKAKVGSVAGFINSCTVTNVFAENVKVTGTYIGDAQTGGFIGFVENVFENDDTPAIISNCGAVNVEVTGQWHVGGLIGRATNNPYNANDDGYHIYVKDVFVSGVVIANRRQGGLIGSFTGWLENAVSDVVLKLHPSPANTQNSCGLILGAIEYKSSGTPATYIKNVVGSGDMTEIIENKTGRTASFVPYYGTPLDKITIEDVYITIEPYLKNGTSDYNEGFAGVQITMENATSYNWYYGTLKTFDFINTWEIKEGELPTVKYVDDRSLVRYALEVFFDIPEEVDSDLVLVKDTLIQGVEIVWSSDNEAIAADGAVTRPAFVDGDATVRLTAKYVVNGVEYTKEFDVLVKCEEPTEDEKFAVVKGELEEAL